MRKADEMEQSLINKSAVITSLFYTFSLSIYALYLFISKGEGGVPFIIVMVGNILLFSSLRVYKNRMK